MTAIARALSTEAKLVIMDEPTSRWPSNEVPTLFRRHPPAQGEGVSIVFVSHRLDELYAVCDRITVLRDGRTVEQRRCPTSAATSWSRRCSAASWPSSSRTGAAPSTARSWPAAAVLEAPDLRRGRALDGVTVSIRPGEIVGLAGLLGSGRTETARALFGADPLDSRQRSTVDGTARCTSVPADAIKHGSASPRRTARPRASSPTSPCARTSRWPCCPACAATASSTASASTRSSTASSGARHQVPEPGPADPRTVRRQPAEGAARPLAVHRSRGCSSSTSPPAASTSAPSGRSRTWCGELADDGLAVLLISSELEEIIADSDRVVRLRDGATVAELTGDQITENVDACTASPTGTAAVTVSPQDAAGCPRIVGRARSTETDHRRRRPSRRRGARPSGRSWKGALGSTGPRRSWSPLFAYNAVFTPTSSPGSP